MAKFAIVLWQCHERCMLIENISQDYRQRREALGKRFPNAVFILPANAEYIRNDDVHYEFRQDSNLLYLTGYPEAGSCAVICSDESGKTHFTLFVQDRDKLMEMWEGERYGKERAKDIFGPDDCRSISELSAHLPKLMGGASRLFYRLGLYPSYDQKVLQALETHRKNQGRTGKGYLTISDAKEAIGELRVIKSESELALMRKAAKISAQAHRTLISWAQAGMSERELEARFEYEVKMGGCKRLGYGSIVARGKNATCLHYRDNNDRLQAGDLVLVDAGGEYEHYSADITRTFPVNPEFSQAQKTIYEIVLKAQKNALKVMKAGVTRENIYMATVEPIVEGLLEQGILKGKPEKIIAERHYTDFYPHSWGHFLGMDVHDAGRYVDAEDNHRPLEAGMCLTIEPGIYFQPLDTHYPEAFRGIGVRIEDDVVLTASGCEVLTQDVPKELEEIKALRESAKG